MFLFSAPLKPLIVLALLLLTAFPASILANLSDQRSDFLKAERALKNGNMQQFEELKTRLAGYPLLPYIEYQELLKRLSGLDPKEAEYFLIRNQDTPVADRFRRTYLYTLGKQGRWKEYQLVYRPTSNALRRCFHLQALLHAGKTEAALNAVETLWLSAKSMPTACDPMFKAWRNAGRLTQSLIWKRIELAMLKRNTKLTRYLGSLLPKKERPWLDLWLQVNNRPERIEKTGLFSTKHGMRGSILLHGLKLLARQNPRRAASAWDKIVKQFHFSSDQKYQAERALARAWIRYDYPDVMAKLKGLSPKSSDHRMQELRIRVALDKKEWTQALEWIDTLPPKLQTMENWRYWRARMLQETGEKDLANTLFRSLAKQRSYHGFLAADRAGLAYNLNHKPLSVSQETINALASREGFQRSKELLELGRLNNARREWRAATKDLSTIQLQSAAKLAQRWDWHSQAIFTLARTKYWDDLELRFPLEHEQHVESFSTTKSLDKAWVLAVIRQESAFSADAESHAGALGLMQLMPATARGTAKSMNLKPPKRRDLLTPATNINIGTSYLKKVFDRLNDNTVLAISAYNAGPHRVLKWLPEKRLDADLWVEMIPFKETRRYTQRVLAYSVIYDKRLGNKVTPLKERMPTILPDSIKTRSASL